MTPERECGEAKEGGWGVAAQAMQMFTWEQDMGTVQYDYNEVLPRQCPDTAGDAAGSNHLRAANSQPLGVGGPFPQLGNRRHR